MANIKFNNLQEIKKYLNKQTEIALKNTLKILKNQLKEFVKEDVYDAYSPKFYERTEWLLQDGVIDYYIGNSLNNTYGGVRINTNKNYPVDLENFQHGNVYSGEFYSENFIAMLNGQIADAFWNPFHFPVLNRVSFLEEFEEWMDKNYVRIFKEECAKLGINLDKVNQTENKVSTIKQIKSYNPSWANRGIYSATRSAATDSALDRFARGTNSRINKLEKAKSQGDNDY